LTAPPQRGVGIPTADGVVFGLFHGADPNTPPTTAALFVPPFGWEDMCSYRSRRLWAQTLAASGHPALRIDLPATGESSGSPREGGQLRRWTDAVARAATWLREMTGSGRVVAIGIGLGGLVAAHAAAGGSVDDMVLWAVNSRGKRLLRELRAFASLNSDVDPDDLSERTDLELPPSQPDGSLAVGGFLLSAETVAELEALDLAADPFEGDRARRALLLGRDGVQPDERLRERLVSAGVEVEVAPGDGYNAMMNHPQEAQPPLEVFAHVSRWLADGPVVTASPRPPAVSAEQASFDVPYAHAAVRETPLALPLDFGDLYGVMARSDSAPSSDLTAVLLNAGALRRIGPGRLWVELSRDWAARGIPTLRLDLEGLGDADGHVSPYADTADLYVERLVEQTLAAVDQLAQRGLGSRFLLGGLCSGAFWSFHAALRDARVEAAFLLNPRALYYDELLDPAREARRVKRIATSSGFSQVVRGNVSPRRAATLIRATAAAPFRARSEAAAHRLRRAKIDSALDELDASGKRILWLFGDDEPLYDEMLADGQVDRVSRAPAMRLELIPGRDHSFRPISAQRHVRAVLDQAIAAELGATG
jgi:alpha-beta hydrolase superfamily lysophospholipase